MILSVWIRENCVNDLLSSVIQVCDDEKSGNVLEFITI